MNQDKIINHILRDLKLFELISKDITGEFRSGEMKPYLQAVYTAAYENGWLDAHQTTAKAIGQYNMEGKLIATFPSLRQACKATGFSKSGIQHSMKTNIPTRQRWVWKYI